MNSAATLNDLKEAIRTDSFLKVERIIRSFNADSEALYTLLNCNDFNNDSDNCNETVLKYAIRSNCSLNLIRLLLENGSTTETETGETALWMAIKQNRPLELIQLLLEFKADIFVLNVIDNLQDKCTEVEAADNEKDSGLKLEAKLTYSLLHLALTTKTDDILRVLVKESKLLVNDQRNLLKETPLIFACEYGKNLEKIRILLDFFPDQGLTDVKGLTAYEHAALRKNLPLCLLLEDQILRPSNNLTMSKSVIELDNMEGSFVRIKKKLYHYHREHVYQLDTIYLDQNRWFHLFSGEPVAGSKESYSLPVSGGLWEWCGDWTRVIELKEIENLRRNILFLDNFMTKNSNHFNFNRESSLNIEIWFRMRRKLTEKVNVDYLERAVQMITEAEDQYFKNGLKLNVSIWKLYQSAISLLLDSLRSETDPQKKSKTAPYLQMLMQKAEEISEGSGGEFSTSTLIELNLSQTNLMTYSHSVSNPNLTNLPQVTRASDYPDEKKWKNRLSKISKIFRLSSKDSLSIYENQNLSKSSTDSDNDNEDTCKSESINNVIYDSTDCKEVDSDTDSLKNCPVCSDRLNTTNRADHINSCLTNLSKTPIIGDRFTTKILEESAPIKECPICYEEFRVGDAVAVMNCLCQFHEKCIISWFDRSVKRQCPYHCE